MLKTIQCASCDLTVLTGRKDTKTCSAACRQRLSRDGRRARLDLSVALLDTREQLLARGATEAQADDLLARSRELLRGV